MSDSCSRVCSACDGFGRTKAFQRDESWTLGWDESECPECKGTGEATTTGKQAGS